MKYAICIHQQNSVDRVIMDIVNESDIYTFVEIMMIRWRGELTPHHYNNITKCTEELVRNHTADMCLGYHHYRVQIKPTESKKYYKVVDYHLRSAIAGYDYSVQYKIGEFVRSKDDSKLFVFNNIDDALDFSGSDFNIYECAVINPVNAPNVVLDASGNLFHHSDYIKYWYNYQYHQDNITKDIDSFEIQIAPKNTVLCDAVKLTRRIS